MPTGLSRFQNTGDLHFITFSCIRHRPILGTPRARDSFLIILEETRSRYRFQVIGYVVMPDHVHLLLSEPETHLLSTALQVLKQRFSRTRHEQWVWEERYHYFNVRTEAKHIEKLRYIHRNPVKRGLVSDPDQRSWSSFRTYAYLEPGPVTITRSWQKPTTTD